MCDSTEHVDTVSSAGAVPPDAEAPSDDFKLDGELGPAGRKGVVLRYDGEDVDHIEGIPTRDSLAAEGPSGKFIKKCLEASETIFFMPNDVADSNTYVGGAQVYSLQIFGVTMDGSKAEVVITGIPVFFDVEAPPGGDLTAFDARLRQVLVEAEVSGVSIETVLAHPSRGYHVTEKPFKRISTANLQQRKKAIAAIRAAGLTTASDDRTCYYRKAARENGLPLSDWAKLVEYEYTAGPTDKSPLCTHIFRVDVSKYKPLIDTMADKSAREAAARTKAKHPLLAKDRTLVLTWDIETHTKHGAGDVPRGDRKGDECFMICMTAHWKDDLVALSQICLVDVASAPDPAWTTVVCGTPLNVLKAFALCWRALAPDIQAGFNDSNYDWPFIVERAARFEILGWMFQKMTATPRRNQSDADIRQWNYCCDKKVKITAEEVFSSSYLKVPGCVPIDVRVCFKKLFPKSEVPKASSLKFYLEISGLPSKADMPITRMWRYYTEALGAEGAPSPECAEHMRHVSHYCVVDALRCQQLLIRRNIINDYRETSSLAFVSLFDSHYYAGGMKVCNLLGAYAWRRNILVSMIPRDREEGGKYPGAYVFSPERGLSPDPGSVLRVEKAIADLRAAEAASAEAASAARAAVKDAFEAFDSSRPSGGLDFSSLYPSVIMAYNLSPEKIVLTAEEADHWRARGCKLHAIEFPFNGRTVRGWSVLHENRAEDIGLYPAVLIDLFAKRAEMKLSLGEFGAIKELHESAISIASQSGVSRAAAFRALLEESRAELARTSAAVAAAGAGGSLLRVSPGSTAAEEVAYLHRLSRQSAERAASAERVLAMATTDAGIDAAADAEYKNACFGWTCANTKQNALKVYMNTFYGEAGNGASSFFMLELAGGVTSGGQYCIKSSAEFVRARGFRIKYGDTDSLYLAAPGRYFVDCDADYAAGRVSREEWMSAMVRITMRALGQVRDEVNAYLRNDNGTGYLKMAFEEVLYPIVYAGMKKYFGVPHVNEVNFHPEKLFIRGIDVVKQGQPGLARTIGYKIMNACMSLDNERTLRQIVEDALRDAVVNGSQWNFSHFVKTDAWKPDKQNVPVQRFIARMKGRHAIEVAENARIVSAGGIPKPLLYKIPDPGERFSYVIVKTGASFDLQGRKSAIKKGDRMEFEQVALKQNLEIDVAFYMLSYVVGLCARFINSEAEFQPPGGADIAEKKVDELSQKAAKKSLEGLIKSLSNLDSNMLKKRGFAYRRAFGQAAAAARGALVRQVGPDAAEVLQGRWIGFECFIDNADESEAPICAISRSVNLIWASADTFAQSLAEDGGAWCETLAAALGIAANGSNVDDPNSASILYRATASNGRRPPTGRAMQTMSSFLLRVEEECRASIAALTPRVADIAARYEAGISYLVEHHRAAEHLAHPEIGACESGAAGGEPALSHDDLIGVAAGDAADLLSIRRAWFRAVGIQLTRARITAYNSYLRRLKDRRLNVAPVPSPAERVANIALAASKIRIADNR